MSFTIIVQDFQSISKATIEVEGFTVVTGTNNTGKSALMRAVRSLFTNARGSSFVRYGAAKTKITVALDSGDVVSWEKGAKTNSYNVNGKALNKVGTGVPSEVEALGIVPITLSNGSDIWPQFAPQFTGQTFLLDQPGSVLAEVLSDVDRVATLNRAKSLAESDARQAQSNLKIRKADLSYTQDSLAAFDGIETFAEVLQALQSKHAAIESIANGIQWLHQKKQQYFTLQKGVALLQEKLSGLSVPSKDTHAEIAQMQSNLRTLQDNRSRYQSLQSGIATLKNRLAVVVVPPASVQDIQNTQRDLIQTQMLSSRYTSALSQRNKILANTLQFDYEKAGKLQNALNVLQDLLVFTRNNSEKHKKLKNAVLVIKQRIVQNESQAVALESEIAAIPKCPVCGKISSGGCE